MEKLIEYIENEIKILEDKAATPYSFSLRSIYADAGKHAAYRDILNFIEENKDELLYLWPAVAERPESMPVDPRAELEKRILDGAVKKLLKEENYERRFAELETKIEILEKLKREYRREISNNQSRIYSAECRLDGCEYEIKAIQNHNIFK